MTSDLSEETRQTIADFGEQWTKYRDNPEYYGSADLLADIFGALLPHHCAEPVGRPLAG